MKKIIVFLVFVCLSFFSCRIEETGVFFDSQKFNSNKAVWEEKSLESYEFSYLIWSSAGTLFEADVTVNNGVASVDIKKIFNEKPSSYPSEELNRKIEYCKEIGLYITSVEDIFSYIEELYGSSKKKVEESPSVYSVTLSVDYDDNYGVPLTVKSLWDAEKGLIGLVGPDLYIENFKLL